MTARTDVDLTATGRALAGRIRSVAAAVRRLQSFVPMPGPAGGPANGAAGAPGNGPAADAVPPDTPPLLSPEACRALVARALHAASAPQADAMLQRLAGGPAASRELAALTGQPTLAVWETVSDLVQVGLVERDLERDQVRLTSAGRGVLELLDALAATAAEEAGR